MMSIIDGLCGALYDIHDDFVERIPSSALNLKLGRIGGLLCLGVYPYPQSQNHKLQCSHWLLLAQKPKC